MTKTNNESACGLDNKRQAEPPRLNVGSCSKLNVRRLFCIKKRLCRIEKSEPQNVILHQL